jgi:hypothetical protein
VLRSRRPRGFGGRVASLETLGETGPIRMSVDSGNNGVVWIALAEVEQRPGTGLLLDRNCAYTNVLALAQDRAGFVTAVKAFLDGVGFDLISMEDEEPLSDRMERFTVAEEIRQLAEEVAAGLGPRWGTFYTWTAED